MKQKKKIIMLPSEGLGRIYKDPHGHLYEVDGKDEIYGDREHEVLKDLHSATPQHLYILSDEEIKVGDWHVSDNHVVLQANKLLMGLVYAEGDHGRQTRHCKKIIATTDAELHYNKIVEEDMHMYKESLPQIPQHIIEAYVKKPFDEVEVEYERQTNKGEWKDVLLPSEWGDSNPTRPKLNKDGTLAVSLVEEKMYSREEVGRKIKEFVMEYAYEWNADDIEEWIKDNL